MKRFFVIFSLLFLCNCISLFAVSFSINVELNNEPAVKPGYQPKPPIPPKPEPKPAPCPEPKPEPKEQPHAHYNALPPFPTDEPVMLVRDHVHTSKPPVRREPPKPVDGSKRKSREILKKHGNHSCKDCEICKNARHNLGLCTCGNPVPKADVHCNKYGTVCEIDLEAGVMLVIDGSGTKFIVSTDFDFPTISYRSRYNSYKSVYKDCNFYRCSNSFANFRVGDSIGITFSGDGTVSLNASVSWHK